MAVRNKRVIEIAITELAATPGDVAVMAKIVVKNGMPAQDESLPHEVEAQSWEVGQALMRDYYRVVMERADRELVLSMRDGNDGAGIRRMGTRRYTIKTRFGTVVMRRIRIQHKANGYTQVPSHQVWQTPQQRLITTGLKTALCQKVVKQTFSSTVRQLEIDSGEPKLLSKSSVGNILHDTGRQLQLAQQERAVAVHKQDDGSKRLLGRAEAYLSEEIFERTWLGSDDLDEELWELDDEEREEQLQALYHQIQWDVREPRRESGGQESSAGAQAATQIEIIAAPAGAGTPNNSADLVIVEADEVVVRSQESDKRWLIHYTAVVFHGENKHYFSAPTAAQLLYQVSGLLATLKVQTDKQLLLISDGAAWIRSWYESIGVAADGKQSVLCWYHLKKHCWRLIREGVSKKEDRLSVRKALFDYLWRGQVIEARAYLTELLNNIEDGISRIAVSDIKALAALKEYLLMREQHIPDYLARLRAGKWIANVCIEKFNDLSISTRCKKKNGMKWTQKGVGAIAALETARRNGELTDWQEHGQLPAWPRAA